MTDTRTDPTEPQRVVLGSHVLLELVDQGGAVERLAVSLVPDAQADLAQGLLGAGTPLARAIVQQAAGTTVPYAVGDMVAVRILHVEAGADLPEADVERRREMLRQAVARAEATNDAIFALAAGSKWGDYDPGKIEAAGLGTDSGASDT